MTPEIEKLNECFLAGGQARVAGKDLSDNPHKFDTPEAGCWIDGWWHMDDHLVARDQALQSIGWWG